MITFSRRFIDSSHLLLFAVFTLTITFGVQIAAANPYPIKVVGDRHTLVLLSDGTVVGWGPCDWGELGPIAAVPQRRNWATALVAIKLPRKAVDIAAGDASSLALLDDGTIVAWGTNYKLLLGSGDAGSKLELPSGKNGSENPVRVASLTDVAQIAASGSRAVAVRRDGTVYVWGESFKGIYGDGKTPAQVPNLRGITQISVSGTHAMALDGGGRVWTWGGNLFGTLGRSTDLKSAAEVPGLADVVSIAAGNGVSTVVKKDGTVWVWGSNSQAQFGNGKQTDAPVNGASTNEIQLTPQTVSGIRNAVSVTSGGMGRHTLVLVKDGSLRGWGNSDWGQIGAGVSGDFQPSPVTPKITNVKAVFAVQNNSYAVRADNTFWMWGTGWDGEFPLKMNVKLPKMLELK